MTLSNEQVEIKEEALKVEENTSDLVDSSFTEVSAKAPNLLTFLQNSLIPLTVSNVDVDIEVQQASETAHDPTVNTAGSVKKYMDSTMFLNLIRQSDTAKAKNTDHIEQENEYCDLVLNELTQILPVPVSDS